MQYVQLVNDDFVHSVERIFPHQNDVLGVFVFAGVKDACVGAAVDKTLPHSSISRNSSSKHRRFSITKLKSSSLSFRALTLAAAYRTSSAMRYKLFSMNTLSFQIDAFNHNHKKHTSPVLEKTKHLGRFTKN